MRLWTLHPRYLDSRGLVALWRESLLAQKVLAGQTRGYRRHPQLQRFREQPWPELAISTYLWGILEEAGRRDYRFDSSKVLHAPAAVSMIATEGQVQYEWRHLLAKLRQRAPSLAQQHAAIVKPLSHPLFTLTQGPVAEWEKAAVKASRARGPEDGS